MQEVELVDDSGGGVGRVSVEIAHRIPGMFHRAFSLFVVDEANRFLVQRRSFSKSRFPGLWANSCCGHPGQGEGAVACARRRVTEELGISVVNVRELGTCVYRVQDDFGNIAEHEYNHVLMGEMDKECDSSLNAEEVEEVRWVSLADLSQLCETTESAPWLWHVVRVLTSQT